MTLAESNESFNLKLKAQAEKQKKQERRAKQARTLQLPRCACNNIARQGSTMCGKCEKEYDKAQWEESMLRTQREFAIEELKTAQKENTLEERVFRIEAILDAHGMYL